MNLVIGYGNPLRADDGAGHAVAEAVRLQRQDVQVLTPTQLLPEHADAVASAHVVVFVDASEGPTPGVVDCRSVRAVHGLVPDHTMTPERLLALAHSAFGADPDAWLVTIRGARFGLHEGLSHTVAAAIPEAAALVIERLAPRHDD